MNFLVAIIICVIAISFIVIAVSRTRLKNKSNEFAEKLSQISSYSENSGYEQARERMSILNERVFVDIPTDLNNCFYGKVISATQKQNFVNHYKAHFHEA